MRLLLLAVSVGLLASCQTAEKRDYAPTAARFFIESANGEGAMAVLPQSGVRIAVASKPVVTEFDVANVEIAQVELGQCLLFQLTPAAARDLYRLTGANQGRRLVLTLNGNALGARRIERPFADGTILVFVEVPDHQLPELVRNLKGTTAEVQRAAAQQR